ncbi:cyanophycinase [Rhodanobacter sp. MP1X3]|uniref:cyanophycinase n=1 Tax=Rhodanobacter sp. MP1X3 TaxID=2723086 RepID=UPI0017BB60EC|nr:cyanophycinase [Rhodanobacter sp. MP1X3]MBB6242782.1 cyanophycinase [Rhodanobacter sp. MP1X3]
MTPNKDENEIDEGRMSPSRVVEGEQRGWIVPIGGAEEKENDPRILKRFVELCGGGDANIVVIPTASQLADTGERYEKLFTGLGVGEVGVLDFDMRRDTEEKNRLARLDQATGIFFTGGNQLRLSTMLGGTPVAQRIRALNARGVHVGGTSAGASILSEHMIAFGKEGLSPTAGSVRLAPGLGLTNRFIIDQHFSQRDRLGRLMAALAYNPYAVGIGLDEDTAAFIRPDNTVEVEGSGSVTVLDAGNLQFSSMAQAGEHDPVCMLGVTIHVLIAGATFNMQTRHASAGTLATPKKSD